MTAPSCILQFDICNCVTEILNIIKLWYLLESLLHNRIYFAGFNDTDKLLKVIIDDSQTFPN